MCVKGHYQESKTTSCRMGENSATCAPGKGLVRTRLGAATDPPPPSSPLQLAEIPPSAGHPHPSRWSILLFCLRARGVDVYRLLRATANNIGLSVRFKWDLLLCPFQTLRDLYRPPNICRRPWPDVSQTEGAEAASSGSWQSPGIPAGSQACGCQGSEAWRSAPRGASEGCHGPR